MKSTKPFVVIENNVVTVGTGKKVLITGEIFINGIHHNIVSYVAGFELIDRLSRHMTENGFRKMEKFSFATVD